MDRATAGPGAEIICGASASKCFASQEYSPSSSPLKCLCLTVVPCIFLLKPSIQICRENHSIGETK